MPAGMNGTHYHIPPHPHMILERADLEDAAEFSYGASSWCYGELSGTDEKRHHVVSKTC